MNLKNKIFYFIFTCATLIGFQNCGGYFDSLDSGSFTVLSSSNKTCDAALSEFENGFLKTVQSVSCQNCHDNGSNKLASFLPFAQTNSQKAHDAFIRFPFNQYINNVKDNHQIGNISYNSAELSAQLTQDKENYEKAIEDCKNSDTTEKVTSLLTNEAESDLFDLTRVDSTNCGFNDAIKISVVQAPFSLAVPQVSTLTWDLGNLDAQWEGVTVKLDVTISNPNTFPKGNSPLYACPSLVGYLVGNLRVSSSKNDIRLKNIKIFINDDDKDEYSYWNIDQVFSAGSMDRVFDEAGTSFISYSMEGVSMKANNKWRLFIESIQVEK